MIDGTLSPKVLSVSDSVTITGPCLALVAPLDLTEACLASPAFRAVKNARPDLSAVVLCPKSAVPLWALHFPQILPYDEGASPQKLAERFSSGTFHSALILEDSRAARALSRLDVPQRIGRDLPELAKLITDPVSHVQPVGPPRHRVTRYLDLAQALGCDPNRPENFTAPPKSTPERPLRIALAPDSDLGPAAQWPVEHFQALTTHLGVGYEAEFFLLSMPGKSPAADALGKLLGHDPASAQSKSGGDITLDELVEILPSFATLVSGNGTLLSLAAHLGIPTVALLGPHSPLTHRPLGRIHEVLTTYAECSPCNLTKCPLDHRCLQELAPETVAKAVSRVLAARATASE